MGGSMSGKIPALIKSKTINDKHQALNTLGKRKCVDGRSYIDTKAVNIQKVVDDSIKTSERVTDGKSIIRTSKKFGNYVGDGSGGVATGIGILIKTSLGARLIPAFNGGSLSNKWLNDQEGDILKPIYDQINSNLDKAVLYKIVLKEGSILVCKFVTESESSNEIPVEEDSFEEYRELFFRIVKILSDPLNLYKINQVINVNFKNIESISIYTE